MACFSQVKSSSDCEIQKEIHKKVLTLVRTGSKINKLVKDK